MAWPKSKPSIITGWGIELRTIDVDGSLHSGLLGVFWQFKGEEHLKYVIGGTRVFKTRKEARDRLREITHSDNIWIKEHYKHCRVVKVIQTIKIVE